MDLTSASFGPDTVAMMGRVCDEAWHEMQTRLSFPLAWGEEEIRSQLALRVMAAFVDGEQDPERLKDIAMDAIDG